MRRATLAWSLLLMLGAPTLGSAQDQGLDLLRFVTSLKSTDEPVEARAIQIYRIPLSYRLREMEDHRWGIRVTFPVSLSAVRVEAVSDISRLVKSLGVAAVVPGLELEIPVGDRVRLRPFGEAGIGKGSEGEVKVLYGSGLRGRILQPVRRVHLTFGGSGMYRKPGERGDQYKGHGTFEAGVDAQVPLGFAIRGKAARAGVFGIARRFIGLELEPEGRVPIVLDHQLEVGVSFATEPDLRVWKIRLPWIAAGYQFGPVLSGLRFYTAFPF